MSAESEKRNLQESATCPSDPAERLDALASCCGHCVPSQRFAREYSCWASRAYQRMAGVAGTAKVLCPWPPQFRACVRMDDTALTPGGLSPRFAALLEELAAVHLEEALTPLHGSSRVLSLYLLLSSSLFILALRFSPSIFSSPLCSVPLCCPVRPLPLSLSLSLCLILALSLSLSLSSPFFLPFCFQSFSLSFALSPLSQVLAFTLPRGVRSLSVKLLARAV